MTFTHDLIPPAPTAMKPSRAVYTIQSCEIDGIADMLRRAKPIIYNPEKIKIVRKEPSHVSAKIAEKSGVK